jgi:hypothetical protein
MDYDFRANALGELDTRGLLPPRVLASFLCGSLARGWGNAKSDADVYLVVPEPWVSNTATGIHIPLDLGIVPLETIYVGERQWEVKYWQERQVEQILDKVGWPEFENDTTEQRVTRTEQDLLARLASCQPISGDDWISHMQQRVHRSAFEAIIVSEILLDGELMIEDAEGQADADDVESAVLSARLAFSCAVDALVVTHGQYDRNPKWRARRMRGAAPTALPFDRYWALETMRDLDPANPLHWVRDVLGVCRELLSLSAKHVRRGHA